MRHKIIDYINITCKKCNLKFSLLATSKNKLRQFCSKKCATSYINLGRKHSKEICEQRSKNNLGSKNPFYGKTHSIRHIDYPIIMCVVAYG